MSLTEEQSPLSDIRAMAKASTWSIKADIAKRFIKLANLVAELSLNNKRMFVYFRTMRHKDDKKLQAICDAVVELITANGFADTSMAKIAKAANVSPATIYVYFENKEDLLNKIYLFVKHVMSAEILKGVTAELPVAKAFEIIWNNYYQYAIKNPVRFAFTEQFVNSPMVDRICKEESGSYFKPMLDLFERGKKEKIFTAFTFAPLTGLIKEHVNGEIVLDRKMLKIAYQIAWDAVTN